MSRILRRLFDRLFGDFARKQDLDRLYDQIAGLVQIQRVLEPTTTLGPLRGWALSPDAIVHVLADLQHRENPTMVEFGSGESTLIFGSFLKRKGHGKLVSIDHYADYAAKIKARIEALNLGDVVELQLLDLTEMSSSSQGVCKSYDLSSLSHCGKIDVAIVDGPPQSLGLMTRFYPLCWALERLSDGGTVFLDDSKRESENAVLREVLKKWPAVTMEQLEAEKGLTALRFKSGQLLTAP